MLHTTAIVLQQPEKLAVSRLELTAPGDEDVVVDVDFSGISTGTERLLWSGAMPAFPGMGYPLVPGYESVGRIRSAGKRAEHRIGERVFVPGASCFGPVKGLFGGAARRLVVRSDRAHRIVDDLGEDAVLFALAATAQHAINGGTLPDLIVGHGVLGRLLARLTLAAGGSPTVWETKMARRSGSAGYAVIHPEDDPRQDYKSIYDVSGDSDIVDRLVGRLAPGGEIVLAGFYSGRLGFAFPPAFMKEARLRIAAEWKPCDLAAVRTAVASGQLSLKNLVTHRATIDRADHAYRTAFDDPDCLKMVLDWRDCQ